MNPWKLEEELLLLGIGPRAAAGFVHETAAPEMWIGMRAAGFGEGPDAELRGEMRGVGRMFLENVFGKVEA